MSELHKHPNIAALIARPSEKMSGAEVYEVKRALLNSVAMLGEADLYEQAAKLGKSDPAAAHAMLIEQGDDPEFEAVFPMIRVGLLTWFAGRMDAIAETRDMISELAAGGPIDRAREAAFRAAPGRYLPEAERSSITLLHSPGVGMIRLGGRDLPWTYAAAGWARADLRELSRIVADGGYAGGVLVGPPEAGEELTLPDGFRFVAVEGDMDGGRAA